MARSLRYRVVGVKWFHSIDLGNGIVTPGASSLSYLDSTADVIFRKGVSGASVLDVGAWDGYYSFQAKMRGAARVMATDWFCWGSPGWGTREGFDLARQALGLQIEDREIDVLDITLESVGYFDVVLFLGVLYHLKNPFLVIEELCRIVKKTIIIEAYIEPEMEKINRPAAMFYPFDELNKDGTNWWGPNKLCVTGMLKAAGFTKVEYAPNPGFPSDRAIFWGER